MDSLQEYRKRRDFTRTPEPVGEPIPPEADRLHFVVQKHQASHLHYDFRLELDGVLKSWAIPKGPSLDPAQKKLAMQTEDHPIEYRDFEGLIAEGNYGAGTVMIWDEGTYSAPGAPDVEETEEVMRKGLRKGSIHFILDGKKLRGEFSLVKMHGEKEENSWLLVKKDDRYASKSDILKLDDSVRTGRTLDQIQAEEAGKTAGQINQKIYPPNNASAGQANPAGLAVIRELERSGAVRGELPEDVAPMLATLAEEPFDRLGWLFEIKWDGFRAIAGVHRDHVDLCSRKHENYDKEFSPIARELKNFPVECVLDGEIVVVDEQGRPSFKLLQEYRRTGQGLLVYYVFDLLYLEGFDLKRMPLIQRKRLLKQILPGHPRIKYSDHIEEQGVFMYKQALEMDLEGVIAKEMNSQYRPGVRSTDWLKFKTHLRQEAVIGGYTEPRGGRKNLGALLLGVYEGGDLVYVGHTGGGFQDVELSEVRQKLESIRRDTCPFKTKPKTNAPAAWVEPRLVCEVRFADWTREGYMRQPVYMGLRNDKEPQQVRRERPVPVTQALKRRKLLRREEPKEAVRIQGKEIPITHPNKVFWAEEGIKKGELLDYYRRMAGLILPYLVDRPQSLHRFPNGIQGKSFFQKDVDEAPDWVKRVHIDSDSQAEGIDYLVCQDEATLIYIVNLGCIEINVWNSRVGRLDKPDYLVIDLDPIECTFDEVITTALKTHEVLEEIEVAHSVKTSGATGLHIYIPLAARYIYEQARQFAQLVGRIVNGLLPENTSLERSPEKRKGKIYLDYLQNRRGQTMAAPYCVRPRPGAPVSTPLKWDEVRPGLFPTDFSLSNIEKRIDKVGDLWRPVLGPGIDMAAALKNLERTWEKKGWPGKQFESKEGMDGS